MKFFIHFDFGQTHRPKKKMRYSPQAKSSIVAICGIRVTINCILGHRPSLSGDNAYTMSEWVV
eukprot:scaffold29424_cov54-Cyclotella_meneghiniana.AAC.2